MKYRFMLLIVAVFGLGILQSNAQYIDLSTGSSIEIVKHEGNGMIMNPQNHRPVYIYVNTATRDTIYGRTGEVINGKVTMKNGKYYYEGDRDYVYDNGEFRMRSEKDSAGYKKTWQSDGDVKIEYGDYKRKVDPDGDVKVKSGDAKIKIDSDGSHKMKSGDMKHKVDDDGNILVKDDSLKIKAKADGKAKIKDKREDSKAKRDSDDGDMKIKQAGEKVKTKSNKVKAKQRD